jgi:2-dehydro-3-deoxyglucarate aldolase
VNCSVKTRLRQGLPCIGAWSTVPAPAVAEAMAACGFHWLAVDLEHSAIDSADVLAIFLAAERHGVAPFVRLPCADPYLGRRYLDSGAAGLIVPVVDSAAAFRDFAQHCFYAPVGRRGACLSRANGWGDHFDAYNRDFQPVLVPQIESRAGIADVDAIASLDCVDALFIGPYDLSADLGTPGQFDTPQMQTAMAQVLEACVRHGKAPGLHQVAPDPQALQARIKDGYRFIAYATDMVAMRAALGRPLSLVQGS